MGLEKGYGTTGLLLVDGKEAFCGGSDFCAEHEWGIKDLLYYLKHEGFSLNASRDEVTLLIGHWGGLDRYQLGPGQTFATWWNDSTCFIRSVDPKVNAFIKAWAANPERKVGRISSGNPFENAGLALYS